LRNNLEGKRGMVLVDSPFDILRMADQGVKTGWLNVGGVHFKTGRTQVLPYLFLSKEEVSAFKKIISLGIRCECRDVPLAEKHDLAELFDKLGW
jgi:mannose/fructose/N-acetylgalactosamine-specific phosphotransferase system component IIB